MGRFRHLTQALPSQHAAPSALRLPATRADAAVIAEGLREPYFKNSGRRAAGLLVE
ncbi:hypothetical protein [Streptomyces microflavus]|uniref:hypothetical protein n=1 Tax=Streptomyces microflavus TaxID=1919 RepID=UPI003830B886